MKKLQWFNFSPTLMEFAPQALAHVSKVRGNISHGRAVYDVAAKVYTVDSDLLYHELFATVEEAKAFVEDCVERAGT